MATRLLTTRKAALHSDIGQIVKGVNKFVKDSGKEVVKEEIKHEVGENFDPNKKDRKSVVSLLSTLFEHKPYATPVPEGFVDMQRQLSQTPDSNVQSTRKMPKAMQLPEKPKWRQMLDDLKEEQEKLDERQKVLDEQRKMLKKIRGGNRKSKKRRKNKKKKMYTRRRVR